MLPETGPGPEFLKDQYWKKEEFREAVDKAVEEKKRTRPKEGFDMPQKPKEKIPHYLERIKRVAGKTNSRTGERGRLFLELFIFPNYIIKPENISGDYIKNILLGNFAEQRGYERGDLDDPPTRQSIVDLF